MIEEMNAPIPGQSLTDSPGNMPWERSPQYSDPEDALLMHLENLSRPEATSGIIDALDMGLDIQTITEGILRSGVAAGRHTIDISMIIGPVIHEYIKGTADAAGVSYDEGFENEAEKEEMQKHKKRMMTERVSAEMSGIPDNVEEAQPAPEAPMEPQGGGQGIARRPATRMQMMEGEV